MKVVLRKNAFEDTENPHPPTKTRLPVKEYLGKYSRYRKNFCSILKLFLRPILFHGKLSFDNLTYFKLYGNLKIEARIHFVWNLIGFVAVMRASRNSATTSQLGVPSLIIYKGKYLQNLTPRRRVTCPSCPVTSILLTRTSRYFQIYDCHICR